MDFFQQRTGAEIAAATGAVFGIAGVHFRPATVVVLLPPNKAVQTEAVSMLLLSTLALVVTVPAILWLILRRSVRVANEFDGRSNSPQPEERVRPPGALEHDGRCG